MVLAEINQTQSVRRAQLDWVTQAAHAAAGAALGLDAVPSSTGYPRALAINLDLGEAG